MVKIAFFEIEDWEIEKIKPFLKKHKLVFFNEPLTAKNIEKIKDFDIISIFIYSKITPEIISKLPNLRLITTRSMGFDHINLESCKKAKIKVCTAPHYGDNSVAEHTFGLLLSISRNIHKAYLRTINGNYSTEGLMGFDLKGKTLGVIGTGRIGSHVIEMARGFEMNVLAYDCNRNIKLAKKLGFSYTSMNELLGKSDIVSIHVPYCPENHHLINKSTISKMKKGAVLINTSRGPIVDTKALVDSLKGDHLSAVGLDVIEGEEMIKEEKELLHHPNKLDLKKMKQLMMDHEILHNEKVVFTPHIAFYSKEAVQRIIDVTLDNISSFLNKKPQNCLI
jgi:D-lactate dehydrogenase